MTFEKSCGAVVYRKHCGNTEILLIKHINSGHWSFPKGHMEDSESEAETALREVKEETGIDVLIDPTFRETVTYSPRKDTRKEVVYFTALARNGGCTPRAGEIAEVRWADICHAASLLTYENDKVIVNKVKRAICR
ncbi:MAG: NUDIX domain-containing protein [Ruminococcus sp.]|nr:NUDIX domain-containing protein [Ruminococcus sp.]